MQNLFQFLKKFRNFLLFIVLQIFALGLFINSKDFHRSQMTNTSTNVVGWFMEKKYNITKHFNLSVANDSLVRANAELMEQLPASFYPLQGYIFYVNDTLKKQQFQYIPATVINSSNNKRNNYFTLNQGTAQGIEVGMGVIADNGVVGQIVDVSEYYSIVMTVLSDDIKINVKLAKNNEYWLLNWNGKDSEIAQIEDVKRDVQFEVGDRVITRGGDTQFPEGIPVGTIAEIVSEDGEQTISLNVNLDVNYNAVYHVYVVKNLMRQQQLEIEERILSEDQ
jgi:rod shape-determining protein MreC